MKVKDLIKILRIKDIKISIRENNIFLFVTTINRLPKEYLDREIIDIIPHYHYSSTDLESECFVLNVEKAKESD